MLSYFILRGRCRYCGEKISIRYPVVEAMTALLFLAIYIKTGISIRSAVSLVFAILLLLISFIDLETMTIPDFLMLIGIAVGSAYSIYNRSFIDSLIGACSGFLFMFVLSEGAKYFLKKEALGDGDIKLVVMFGAFLGMERTFISIFAGSIFGAVLGISLILLGRLKKEDYIPFAPFLASGAVVSILLW
jgi:leader peptidase (prepilin peptidase)/N-methyltransferase